MSTPTFRYIPPQSCSTCRHFIPRASNGWGRCGDATKLVRGRAGRLVGSRRGGDLTPRVHANYVGCANYDFKWDAPQ